MIKGDKVVIVVMMLNIDIWAQTWPWEDSSLDEMELAYRRMRAMFEFLSKLGVEYWCFHDR